MSWCPVAGVPAFAEGAGDDIGILICVDYIALILGILCAHVIAAV